MAPRFPKALNPFQTRTPTSSLGRFGKSINPLNPRNFLWIAIEEALMNTVGKKLPEHERPRLEALMFGPKVGIAYNILDAGSVADGTWTAHEARLKQDRASLESLKAVDPAKFAELDGNTQLQKIEAQLNPRRSSSPSPQPTVAPSPAITPTPTPNRDQIANDMQQELQLILRQWERNNPRPGQIKSTVKRAF